MNSFKTLCKTLAISTGIFLLSVPTTYGIPPKPLLTAKTTYNQIGSWDATYYNIIFSLNKVRNLPVINLYCGIN